MADALTLPTISILIITYNRPDDAVALLENLKTQQQLSHHVGEILLLDNASTESYGRVEQFIRENRDLPIDFIRHSSNAGVAGGRNILIRKARFPILFVLDDDVIFPEADAIQRAATLFDQPQYQSNNTAVITISVFYFATGARQKNALPHKQYQSHKDQNWFLTYYYFGGAHLMKKEFFPHTGYYPEDFFYGMEEYDLSYRIIQAGYTLAYDHSIKILHKESPLGRVTNKQKLSMMWHNKCVVAWRYLPNIYFYSTSILWALEYLKKTGFDFSGMWQTFKKIREIPKRQATNKISQQARTYLEKVGARLWY